MFEPTPFESGIRKELRGRKWAVGVVILTVKFTTIAEDRFNGKALPVFDIPVYDTREGCESRWEEEVRSG